MLTSGTGAAGGCIGGGAAVSTGGGVGAGVVADASGKFIEGAGLEALAPGTATKLDCIPTPPETAVRAWSKFVVGLAFMVDLQLL